jgi:DNA-binding transcriptional LysR family regulator
MFELSQLRCFVAVAEELHFGRAAARLNMTQPPLSRQIQLLEHALDVSLFERTSRSVRLTIAGQTFLPDARRILQLAEGAGLATRRAASGHAGRVTLGSTAAAAYGVLPRLLELVGTHLPDVDLVVREMVTATQIEALGSGELDLGLVRAQYQRQLIETVRIQREKLMLAVPDTHPLATGPAPSIAGLHEQPLIMWSPIESRYFHDLVSGMFASARIAPRYRQYLSQTHTILALVNAGFGVAVVPEAGRALHFEHVVLRPFRDETVPVAELYLAWRRDTPNPAVAAIISAISDAFDIEVDRVD